MANTSKPWVKLEGRKADPRGTEYRCLNCKSEWMTVNRIREHIRNDHLLSMRIVDGIIRSTSDRVWAGGPSL